MITREDMIEQSIEDFVKEGLVLNGYTDDKVHVRDAFPSPDERSQPLVQTEVAIGFNFDDGGVNIELGSDLKLRKYTIEFWTFGLTQQQGRNVATVIRTLLEDEGAVDLKDIGTTGRPVIDRLLLQDSPGISVTRQIAAQPRPWDRNVFTTTCRIEDTYYPSLVN